MAARKTPAKKAPPKRAAPKAPTRSAMQKALDKFLTDAEKTYGPGKFALGAEPQKYEVISTGSLVLDVRTGVGGYVKGRMAEIWGPEGAGKTFLAIAGMIEAQKESPTKMVMFVNVEHRWDEQWARSHGLDMMRAMIVTPENAEEVADMVKDACRSGLFSMIVVDSIGGMIPEAEKQKDADKAVMMAQAKIVTRMVKIAAVEADATKTVVLLLNQVRANISKYGADTTSSGPHALKHGTTMKFDVRRTSEGALKIGGTTGQQVGHLITVRIERNSVALAFKKAEFALLYVNTPQFGPMGIDRAMEATDLGIEYGIIEQNSGWYTNKITGEKVQGKPAVVESLRANPAVALEVRSRALDLVAGEVVYDVPAIVDVPEGMAFDPDPEQELAT